MFTLYSWNFIVLVLGWDFGLDFFLLLVVVSFGVCSACDKFADWVDTDDKTVGGVKVVIRNSPMLLVGDSWFV